MHPVRTTLPTVGLVAGLVLLAGCASPTSPATGSPDGIELVDGWVKATDEHMTGVFGTLTNHSDGDLHVVGVRSDLAGVAELHVTVDDGAGGRVMQQAEDGFEIPAHSGHVLEPGGDHLMLMELSEPIETGQEVQVTLLLEDGQELPVTITARAFTGAEEHYAPGMDHDEHHATEAP